MHSNAVVVVEYLPPAQIKQLPPEMYCPAIQVVPTAEQAALPNPLTFPTSQLTQSDAASCASAVKAASALYVVTAQFVQVVAVVVVEYLPAAQIEH